MRTEKDKMLAGELYDASAPEIQAELAATHRWLARYNAALDMAPAERRQLLVERLAAHIVLFEPVLGVVGALEESAHFGE